LTVFILLVTGPGVMGILMNLLDEVRQDISLPSGRLSYQEGLRSIELGIKTCRLTGDRL